MTAPSGRHRWVRRITDQSAATAVMFALLIVPILGFVALAFDVGSAVWARSQLDLAADTAALTAVDIGVRDYTVNANTTFTAAQQAGVTRFNAQADAMPNVTLNSVSVAVSNQGSAITAVLNYSATYRTQFASLLGLSTLPAQGLVSTTRSASPYYEISILMDNSASMEIAATQAGMTQLGQLVRQSPNYTTWGQNQNCAFGCHFDANNMDFYGLAKANGIALRMDVLSTAVSNVIQTISQSEAAPQFKVALYGFNTTLNVVYPMTSNFAAAMSAVQALSVPYTDNPSSADTNFPAVMSAITAAIPPSGDGSSAASPRRVLFIVTDGVTDYWLSTNRILGPLDPSLCAALKANGVQVQTLYTQYIPLVPPYVTTPSWFYVDNVQSFVSQIQPNLQACASSPSLAFQASDPTSIDSALQSMLATAMTSPAHFTQ